MRFFFPKPLALALWLALGVAPAFAQSPANDPMKAAAQKAIATNPEVTARLNQLRAAVDAMDIARAGMRPQINLEASAGHERESIATRKAAR